MKRLFGLIVLVFIGAAGWRVGSGLSSDAVSMAVGIFFGILAGIPAALLVLAADTLAFGETGPGTWRIILPPSSFSFTKDFPPI